MAKNKTIFIVIPVVIVVFIVGGVAVNEFSDDLFSSNPVMPDSSTLQVVFFDVGQAECILLKTGSNNMLIDAGNTGQDKIVLNYLAEYNVTTLDYFVATHPHADHFGSAVSVIRTMDNVGTVIMPNVINTTTTFEKFIKEIGMKNIPITTPALGDVFTLGDANIQVVAPNIIDYTDKTKWPSDLNEWSIVLRVEFGDTSFLFTGDAGTKSENIQLTNDLSLKVDVLNVGHHGSSTSTIKKYLTAVSPTYAVISCGTGNPYGHPHKDTLSRLTAAEAIVYRTDESGTIIFETDGKNITITVEYEPEPTPTETTSISYIGNKNSKTFHLTSCSSLPQEQNRVYFKSRQEAIDTGYKPCNICKP